MHANRREQIKDVYAGDIVAAVGLKNTSTGNTLSDKGNPIILEAIGFPEPVISVSIEPKTKADLDKLGGALHKLALEDPDNTLIENAHESDHRDHGDEGSDDIGDGIAPGPQLEAKLVLRQVKDASTPHVEHGCAKHSAFAGSQDP